MPLKPLHKELIDAYLVSMMARDIFSPPTDLETSGNRLKTDVDMISLLEGSRYLNDRHPIPKLGNLDLAWQYAQNPNDHHRFVNMLRVTPLVFQTILNLIEGHAIFQNDSHNPQAPVEQQLAVTLFRMGQYRYGSSVEDIV